jgi:cell division control protein 24
MELGSTVQNKKFTTYYEFCSNYPKAIHEATVCAEDLRKYDKIIPSGHLPSFLIKPVQRICKYPLLLRELLKHTETSDADYPNISSGLDVMKKIAANVNEENRRGENRLLAEDFAERVDDWKGLDFQDFGSLTYMDTFIARFSDTEKEYIVYFFEEYILFCKEGPITKKKDYKEIILRHIVPSSSLVNANDASMRG